MSRGDFWASTKEMAWPPAPDRIETWTVGSTAETRDPMEEPREWPMKKRASGSISSGVNDGIDTPCSAPDRDYVMYAEFINCPEVTDPGATVIDVGINRVERDGRTRLVGDVDFDSAVAVAGAITPVPGGVGPMTIATLIDQTADAAALQLKVEF